MNSKIISFAITSHASCNHLYDGKPYAVHLSLVAYFGSKYIRFISEDYRSIALEACWLHDTIEDCRLTYNDVFQVAGKDVAEIVYALTNEKGRNRKERANYLYYEGIRDIPCAVYVKLCDRLANASYSVQNASKMIEVYRKENEHFIESLLPTPTDKIFYKQMVSELEEILKLPQSAK